MIKATIFDLDGTLQDSEVLWVEAVRNYLSDRGAELTYEEAEKTVYGHGWREIFNAMRQLVPALNDKTPQQVADEMREYYLALRQRSPIAIESSVELLRKLAGRMPVVIVSGAPTADVADSVEHLGIAEHLKFYLGADDYSAGKPSPVGFLKAAEMLGVRPRECLVVEDATAGVMAAKSAGMSCIALARPGRPQQDLSLADVIVSDLSEFDLDEWISARKLL